MAAPPRARGATGVDGWALWFCRERPEKAEIASVLHLEAFVDDRRDVLDNLPKRVRTRLWFEADWSQPRPSSAPLVEPTPVPDWRTVVKALTV